MDQKAKEIVKSRVRRIESNIHNYYTRYRYRTKISNLMKIIPRYSLSNHEKREVRQYFNKYGFKNISFLWHEFYCGILDDFSVEFIPEDLFYTEIEPVFNRKFVFPALSDKNLLSKFFKNIKQPETIFKNINGFFMMPDGSTLLEEGAQSACLNLKEFVIKPSIDSGGGKNVKLVSLESHHMDKKRNQLMNIFQAYKKDYIVQKKVNQNAKMKLLNPSSLNTLRVLSYLKEDQVIVLSVYVRVGKIGQFTDNITLEGVSCGMDSSGKLNEFGFDLYNQKCSKTDFGCNLQNFQIPFYTKVKETAIQLHQKMPNFRFISWDLAIDEFDDIILIEFNPFWQEINDHQLNNGPLFGRYADEILNSLKNL